MVDRFFGRCSGDATADSIEIDAATDSIDVASVHALSTLDLNAAMNGASNRSVGQCNYTIDATIDKMVVGSLNFGLFLSLPFSSHHADLVPML